MVLLSVLAVIAGGLCLATLTLCTMAIVAVHSAENQRRAVRGTNMRGSSCSSHADPTQPVHAVSRSLATWAQPSRETPRRVHIVRMKPPFSARLRSLLLSPAARPLRFAGTGGVAAAVQLAILAFLTHHGWDSLRADALAFLLAAQVNFLLSVTFTWRERRVPGSLLRRWLLYHGSIALMAIVNLLTFDAVRTIMPTLLASLVGIAAGALGNYLAGDRLIFRPPSQGSSISTERRSVA